MRVCSWQCGLSSSASEWIRSFSCVTSVDYLCVLTIDEDPTDVGSDNMTEARAFSLLVCEKCGRLGDEHEDGR